MAILPQGRQHDMVMRLPLYVRFWYSRAAHESKLTTRKFEIWLAAVIEHSPSYLLTLHI